MAMPVADSPSREALDGLSTVLGGWSGGTFASTLLTIADFSPLSRGLDTLFAISDAEGFIPHPDRRYARRQPALSGPPWDTGRKPPEGKPALFTTARKCKSGARLGARARSPEHRMPRL